MGRSTPKHPKRKYEAVNHGSGAGFSYGNLLHVPKRTKGNRKVSRSNDSKISDSAPPTEWSNSRVDVDMIEESTGSASVEKKKTVGKKVEKSKGQHA